MRSGATAHIRTRPPLVCRVPFCRAIAGFPINATLWNVIQLLYPDESRSAMAAQDHAFGSELQQLQMWGARGRWGTCGPPEPQVNDSGSEDEHSAAQAGMSPRFFRMVAAASCGGDHHDNDHHHGHRRLSLSQSSQLSQSSSSSLPPPALQSDPVPDGRTVVHTVAVDPEDQHMRLGLSFAPLPPARLLAGRPFRCESLTPRTHTKH